MHNLSNAKSAEACTQTHTHTYLNMYQGVCMYSGMYLRVCIYIYLEIHMRVHVHTRIYISHTHKQHTPTHNMYIYAHIYLCAYI